MIIVVIVAAVWAYINRDALFSSTPVAESDTSQTDSASTPDTSARNSVDQVPAPSDKNPSSQPAGQETPPVVDHEPAETPVPGWPEPVVSDVQEAPGNPSTEQNPVGSAAMTSAVEPPSEHTESASNPLNSTTEAAQAPSVSPQPVPVSSDGQVTNESAKPIPDTSIGNLLEAARQAYWQGDIDKAIQTYRDAMAVETDNADVAGELGNILFANGDINGAVAAYTEAGRRLIMQHRYGEAERVLDILRRLDPEAAKLFEETLQDAS